MPAKRGCSRSKTRADLSRSARGTAMGVSCGMRAHCNRPASRPVAEKRRKARESAARVWFDGSDTHPRPRDRAPMKLPVVVLILPLLPAAAAAGPKVEYHALGAPKGTSRAVAATDAPLLHTGQLLP